MSFFSEVILFFKGEQYKGWKELNTEFRAAKNEWRLEAIEQKKINIELIVEMQGLKIKLLEIQRNEENCQKSLRTLMDEIRTFKNESS